MGVAYKEIVPAADGFGPCPTRSPERVSMV